jgi:hypothetical protein
MGPAAALLQEAAATASRHWPRCAPEAHATVDGILPAGATWLVEARAR